MRNQRSFNLELKRYIVEDICRYEGFDWTTHMTVGRCLLDAIFSLDFLKCHENMLFAGPIGMCKFFLSQVLGYAAVRDEHSVSFTRADVFFKTPAQSRVDHTLEKTCRSLLSSYLIVLDDFGLQKLAVQQSTDLYKRIFFRHSQSSSFITSNRAVDELLGLFDDPILVNSVLDCLANASYQIIIESTRYRDRLSPHHRKEALTPVGEGGYLYDYETFEDVANKLPYFIDQNL